MENLCSLIPQYSKISQFLNTLHFFVLYSFTNFFFINEVLRRISLFFFGFFSLSSRLTISNFQETEERGFVCEVSHLVFQRKCVGIYHKNSLYLFEEEIISVAFQHFYFIYKTVWNKDLMLSAPGIWRECACIIAGSRNYNI